MSVASKGKITSFQVNFMYCIFRVRARKKKEKEEKKLERETEKVHLSYIITLSLYFVI